MAPFRLASPTNLAVAAVVVGCLYALGTVFYNLFLHPLRAFPGPILSRATVFPINFSLITGNQPFDVAKLHAKYGPVVRIGPNELAFSSPQAWRDIYSHRSAGEPDFPKYEGFYRLPGLPASIVTAPRDMHAQMRRQMAHGFSERSMQGQEPIIGGYVNLLISRLREKCEDPMAVGPGVVDGRMAGAALLDMRSWINWTTFDIIGDLGFGSPFGCLEAGDYHPWVRLICDTVKAGAFMGAISNIGLRPLVAWIFKSGMLSKREQHHALVRSKLRQRMEYGAERPDLVEGLIQKKDMFDGGDEELSFKRLSINASTLIIAGSETTATLLSGAIYLLCMYPEKLVKLAHEVRETFSSDDEITLISVQQNLPYMMACLNETLRCYPPVAIGLPRQSPGANVAGYYVPEGAVVSVFQWAVNHDKNFWTEPDSFAPERFLGDEKYKNDQTDAMQPFSLGPRNCIGRNLAFAEMRLILAKIVYNFDMAIADESRDWLPEQKVYTLWEKPGLNIRLTPVKRE